MLSLRMKNGRNVLGLAAVLAGSALLIAAPARAEAEAGLSPQAADKVLQRATNHVLGLQESTILRLSIENEVGIAHSLRLPINGNPVTVDLAPTTVRSANYQLLVDGENGMEVHEPGVERTLGGELREFPGSQVLGAMLHDGLHIAMLMPNGEKYWLEPLIGRVPGADADHYVLYNNDHVIPSGGTCGTDAGVQNELAGVQADEGGIAGTCGVTELACDADFEYYQLNQSNVAQTEARINFLIALVNLQYDNEVGIRHIITAIIVRSNANDPYTSNDASTLLNQFRNHWLSQQGGIQRDVAHLFTGRNINGGTIGIAFTIGGICTTSAYCLSQAECCGSNACATDLIAHELGHLWGAFHCNCPGNTMNPSITCTNNFSAGSEASIINHRNSRNCLSCPVENDLCTDSIQITPGTTAFTTEDATTDGPSHDDCIDGADGQIYNDVWFKFLAPCSGPIRVSTCGDADYDTKIAVYSGTSCPVNDDRLVGCDDDTPGCSQSTSEVIFDANAGSGYLIRVGGSDANDEGDGMITIECTGPPPANDDCEDAMVVNDGATPFDTTNATTDGFFEVSCTEDGDPNVSNDVWFSYTASCTGALTFSTCGSTYDTKMAVYFNCPSGDDEALECNDDSCGNQSEITTVAVPGFTYLVRVGGYLGATGPGTLTITCEGKGEPCPADISGNGEVGPEDLAAMLDAWGPNPGNPADLNGDGEVGPADLASLLDQWGPCP